MAQETRVLVPQRNPSVGAADREGMTLWTWIQEGRAVLELHAADLELLVLWGDGTTRAAWLCSQSGRVLSWSAVGSA